MDHQLLSIVEEKLHTACKGKLSYPEYRSLLSNADRDIDHPVFYLAEWGLTRAFAEAARRRFSLKSYEM